MRKLTIEDRVMGNVAAIYAVRSLASATALKFYALIFSVGGMVSLVSLPNIAANFVNVAEGGAGSVAFFVVSAILGTTLVVQLALVMGAFAAISLVTPVFRGRSSFA